LVRLGVVVDGFGLALCLHHGEYIAPPRLLMTSVLQSTQELVPSIPPPRVPPWLPPWSPPYSLPSIPFSPGLPTMSSCHSKKAALDPSQVLGRSPEQLLVGGEMVKWPKYFYPLILMKIRGMDRV
jgi:hypothetical protein